MEPTLANADLVYSICFGCKVSFCHRAAKPSVPAYTWRRLMVVTKDCPALAGLCVK